MFVCVCIHVFMFVRFCKFPKKKKEIVKMVFILTKKRNLVALLQSVDTIVAIKIFELSFKLSIIFPKSKTDFFSF